MRAISKTTLMTVTIGIIAGYISFMIPILKPYKESCVCSGAECSVVRYYSNRQESLYNFPQKHIEIKRSVKIGRRSRSGPDVYYLDPLFKTTYLAKFLAERELEKINSGKKSYITRYNFTSCFYFIFALFFLITAYKRYRKGV